MSPIPTESATHQRTVNTNIKYISHRPMEADPFDDVLSLEDQFYAEGHQLGVADGSKAGRIEGRIFGLEKGFDKFVAMGKLHGKAAIWTARLASGEDYLQNRQARKASSDNAHQPAADASSANASKASPSLSQASSQLGLPAISSSERLSKHIQTLYALIEPASISTSNNEDAVTDFDDRFKRAVAKAKLVERLVGETSIEGESAGARERNALPDVSRIRVSGNDTGDANVEDFTAWRGSS